MKTQLMRNHGPGRIDCIYMRLNVRYNKAKPPGVPTKESREQQETGDPKEEIQIRTKGAARWAQAPRGM